MYAKNVLEKGKDSLVFARVTNCPKTTLFATQIQYFKDVYKNNELRNFGMVTVVLLVERSN